MARYFCGIDWSEGLNDVAVVDRAGEVVAAARVEESPAGVKELLQLLRGLNRSHRHSRKQVPIAIETNRGLLVGALRASGQEVVAITPSVVARYRGRLNPTRKKSDRTDAALLANILRTDGALHRGLFTNSDGAAAVTVLARAQLRAVRTRDYHRNQLRSHLREYFPAALEAWSGLPHGLVRAEARAVLALGPTPAQAAALSKWKIADALEAAGRFRLVDDHAERLRAVFRENRLRQPTQVEEAMGLQTLAALALLDQACRSVDDLTEQTTTAFLAHPHAEIYRSFPGCGPVIGARLLGEIGDDPDRFATAKGLRAYAGAAPLTWASGSSSSVTYRRIANQNLKAVGYVWAFTTLRRSPGCRAHYDRRRDAGDAYRAALRNLFGRLLSALHYCLRTGEHYQEEKAFPLARGKEADG
ncbi:IS110 family transposase [Streptomyces olivoreticuli]|uniref:IS110 family transposase n=1 Tax=Streptomyces olivoreticuli TaxID=68246 RepID=UPI000E25C20A|nr:IS110 family transposase [Streptomyces olivoreticuli]